MMRSGRTALILSVLYMFGTALIFAFFSPFLVAIYTNDPEVGAMAAKLLLIAALFQLSDGVQCVSLGILRGLADTRVPTLITIIAYWVIGIPSGYWMAKYLGLECYGMWFGLSLGLTFSAVMLSLRFLKESREFDFVQEEKKHYKELIME